MFITKLSHYPIVLRKPWFSRHNPSMKFSTNDITFDLDYCLANCCPIPARIRGLSVPLPETPAHKAFISGAVFSQVTSRRMQHKVVIIRAITLHELKHVLKAFATATPCSTSDSPDP